MIEFLLIFFGAAAFLFGCVVLLYLGGLTALEWFGIVGEDKRTSIDSRQNELDQTLALQRLKPIGDYGDIEALHREATESLK